MNDCTQNFELTQEDKKSIQRGLEDAKEGRVSKVDLDKL